MVYFRTAPRASVLLWILIAFCAATLLTILMFFSELIINSNHASNTAANLQQKFNFLRQDKFIQGLNNGESFRYNRQMPLAFIGGMPRSGTTLLRVILDAHPDIRCGGETRVIPRILNFRNTWFKSKFEVERLKEAGINQEVFDNAVAEFMLEIIVRHGPPAKRLCNKDPFTLKSALFIHSMFPNAKFLFMIRDGRAVAHSIVSRKISISGFNITSYKDCLTKWNIAVATMNQQCSKLGRKVCLPIHYEQLVLHPEAKIREIIQFLELPWNDSVLHHEELLAEQQTHSNDDNHKHDKIPLSKLERSTDQVIKPVNIESLSTWVGKMPQDVVDDMDDIAPMLQVLGYDPYQNPPNYGQPDEFVKKKMKELEVNAEKWKAKEKQLIKQREEMKNSLIV